MKLILPIAGRSSRFPSMRPKWMLTMPSGELMLEKAVSGLKCPEVDEIIIPYLASQVEEFNFNIAYLYDSSLTQISDKITLVPLPEATKSQPHTVYLALQAIEEEDCQFFIKDCDNSFSLDIRSGNSVAYVDLNEVDFLVPKNKSYIRFNRLQGIEQIIEKKVISDSFCCGGYSFRSAKEFIAACDKYNASTNPDLYISHIIKQLLAESVEFNAVQASDYIDFGTSKEFFEYTRSSKTYFSDFDGVLVVNSSKFSSMPWQYIPIERNLEALRLKLDSHPDSCLVITTSRPASHEVEITKFLANYGINAYRVICGLPHTSRVLINDFAKSNPFPSACSVNLPRNSSDLSLYL